VFIATGDDQQITRKAVEVSVIKRSIRGFVAVGHAAGQQSHLQRGGRTRLRCISADIRLMNGIAQVGAWRADSNGQLSVFGFSGDLASGFSVSRLGGIVRALNTA